MTLGEIIVKYRLEHGLSQRQFALRCGLSNGYIAMIEKNRNPATGKTHRRWPASTKINCRCNGAVR